MTKQEIINLLRNAKTRQEVNILRSHWVIISRDDLYFEINTPEELR